MRQEVRLAMGLTADAGLMAVCILIVVVPTLMTIWVLWLIAFRGRTILRNLGKAGDSFGHAFQCRGPEWDHCNSPHCKYPPFPQNGTQ